MENKSVEIRVEGGTYTFKLESLLEEKGISKNKLVRDTNTDFKVIKRLARGDIVRIDIYVLARLCDYLKCETKDIIEFQRNKENES